ncbi:competence protein ComEA [Pseudomonas agarici]|uniref:Competence protein ComEA n=1 Tax=Pseudomonas agarici TaxID=46677 RepID=A0A0X1T6E1_PSEAA|nr:helix-hairpin-helix domain-containing protein [Pseudomonas agarici]AMB87670.1 competence protein ComEA [Pseudomonas agarici]NWB91688.1 helix-hairpin-helix domain-containing protein [Pseudomonas agarici]NWC10868.1 helix-hairpin-helix domain-containing protein [Pseudomonas agarici]SEK91868.1 competence protein ComEA [Pseudomonas agarici]
MRTGFFPSLLLTVLLGAAGAISAAPVTQASQQATPTNQATLSTKAGKVNLNTADAETIQRELSGIGEAKAQAIVAYREANGPFSSVDELLEVRGIGKAILDKNRDQLGIN